MWIRIPRVMFGIDTAKEIGNECKKLNAKRVLISTDKGIVKAGILDQIQSHMKAAGVEVYVLDEVVANPRADTVQKGAEIFGKEKCDLVIGLGGGSSLDTGKGISLLATNRGSILEYETGKKPISNPPAKLIALPTTAGTGSEVSGVAIITDDKSKKKVPISDPILLPTLSIVDPKLTIGLPQKVTANTGADALSHAIEAYTTIWANPFTDMFALEAMKKINISLREAFANGENLEARKEMMYASTLAGISFAEAGIGIVHSMSHPVGAMYDLSHGLLCGLFLPPVMEFNLIANPSKFSKIAEAFDISTKGMSTIEAGKKSIDAVRRLLEDVEVPLKLQDIGVEKEKLPKLATEIMGETFGLMLNPRKATREDILKLLERSF